jgi:hypothetical protein
MRVYWLNCGLRLEPEGENDMAAVIEIERAIRTLAGLRIAPEVQSRGSSFDLDQAALGSAINVR